MKFWNLLASKFQGPNRSKTRGGRLEKPRLNRLSLEALEERTTPASFASFLEEIPLVGERFAPAMMPQSTLLTQSAPISYASIAFLDQELVGRVPEEELFGSLVVTLQPGEDPLVQIGKALSGYSGIETVRIISHGRDGALVLGGKVVDEDALNRQITEVSAWGRALALDADILLYGCSVASTEAGRQFVSRLALATGADVAASSDPTGARGDLFLEYATGPLQGSLVATQRAWEASGVQLPSEGNFDYFIDGGNATITGYTGAGGAVTVPDTLAGLPVTTIGDNAFFNKTGLTSVTLPDSITTIGVRAFYQCTGLTSITLGNSLTTIGDNAFQGCTSLTSITLPDSVTTIRGAAFASCYGLTSITLPNSITTIAAWVFYGCSGLTSITLPDSITTIEEKAFFLCNGLTSITLPNSLTTIGYAAFVGCTGLTSITLPNSLTTIGQEAFRGCNGLTSIYALGNAPTLVGAYVFENVTATLYYLPATTGWTNPWGGLRTQSISTPTTTTLASSATPSVYGDSITLTTTVVASLGVATGTVTFKDGSTVLGTATLNGSAVATFSLSTLAAGSHSLTSVYTATDNFDASTSPTLTQTVSAKGLTITADAKSKIYGQALPLFTTTVTGLVNGDTPSSIVGLDVSSTATGSSSVGTYTLTPAGTNANYDIAFVSGSLEVTQAQLTINADAKSKVYGADLPQLTTTVTGLVNGDTSASITGLGATTIATASSIVGGYSIVPSGTNSNYSVTLVPGVLTVTQAALTITANNQSKVYGADLPELTTTVTGLVNGDTSANITGLGATTIATASSIVGVYSIVPSGTNSNYSVTLVDGVLTVTQAQLTITTTALASSATPSVYGDSITLTTTVVASLGVATGTVTIKDGSTVLGTATLNGSGVATFSLSTLAAGSHSLTAVYTATDNFDASTSPTLTQTVSPKGLTITADAKSKIYGQALPLFTTTLTGLVNGDTGANITGLGATTIATASSIVGVYSIVPSGTNSNYSVTLVPGVLTVTKAALTVIGTTANNKVYDGKNTAVLNTDSSVLVGIVLGDKVKLGGPADTASTAKMATGTFPSKNVGSNLLVTIVGMTLKGPDAGNYILIQPTTTANITAKGLTVSGTTASNKVYDGNNNAVLNTGSSFLVGFVAGDNLTLGKTTTGTFSSKNVGSSLLVTIAGFTITDADAGNYFLTQPTTTANITKRGLTVSGTTAADKVFDGHNTATINQTLSALVGIVSGDTVTLGGTATGTFPSPKEGSSLLVTIAGFIIADADADAGNYFLTQPTTTASITAKPKK